MRILIFGLLITVFISCQPGLRKERHAMQNRSTSIDSSLYYPQKTLYDPFLDSLKKAVPSTTRIYLTLIPPPPPPKPAYTLVDGWRIQLFAGSDSLNVRALYDKTKHLIPDSVYFFKENGLYKIQIGDFSIRNKADLRLLNLRHQNLKNMWVVARKIKQINQQADTVITSPNENLFSIQILVTGNKQKAETIVSQLNRQFELDTFIKMVSGNYKVFLGHFKTHTAAEGVLEKVHKRGWTDAWINSQP